MKFSDHKKNELKKKLLPRESLEKLYLWIIERKQS